MALCWRPPVPQVSAACPRRQPVLTAVTRSDYLHSCQYEAASAPPSPIEDAPSCTTPQSGAPLSTCRHTRSLNSGVSGSSTPERGGRRHDMELATAAAWAQPGGPHRDAHRVHEYLDCQLEAGSRDWDMGSIFSEKIRLTLILHKSFSKMYRFNI